MRILPSALTTELFFELRFQDSKEKDLCDNPYAEFYLSSLALFLLLDSVEDP